MIVVSAGIRPRDELAREAGLASASAAASWSTTTCAPATRHLRHRRVRAAPGMIYGLVAPGYEMAEVVRREP